MKSYFWNTGIAGKAIVMPCEAVRQICRGGDNLNAINDWRDDIDLSHLSDTDLRELLVEALGEAVDHIGRRELEEYVLWIVAWDVFDGKMACSA